MNSQNSEKNFIGHLEDLRATLINCLAAAGLFFIPAYFISGPFIKWLIKWSAPAKITQLNYFSPMEVFIVQLKLSAVIAFVLSFPYCLWQIWKFLLPALYESERKALKWWVSASCLLFITGAAFCVLFVLPLLMNFSASFASDELKPVIGLSYFLNLAGWLSLAFALMFQFPLAVMLSVRFGLVKTAFLRDKRPYIIVLILIMAALFTPPDIVSQLLLAVPTWLLFELGLLLSYNFEKRNKAENLPAAQQETAKILINGAPLQNNGKNGDGMLGFYISEQNAKQEKNKKRSRRKKKHSAGD